MHRLGKQSSADKQSKQMVPNASALHCPSKGLQQRQLANGELASQANLRRSAATGVAVAMAALETGIGVAVTTTMLETTVVVVFEQPPV